MTETTSKHSRPVDGVMKPEQAAEFSAQLKAQAQRVMSKLPLLGAVTWLMLQHNTTRHTLISEQEWRVLPPLVLDQAKLYLCDNAPIAYVSWAKLSDKIAKRYSAAPHQLAAGDWQSGDQVWIVDLFAPFGGAAEVLQDLRDTVLRGQVIHQLTLGSEGHLIPIVLNPD